MRFPAPNPEIRVIAVLLVLSRSPHYISASDCFCRTDNGTVMSDLVNRSPAGAVDPLVSRLSRTIQAHSYELVIQPYFPEGRAVFESAKNFTFDASSTMHGATLTPTRNLTVHIRDLTIASVCLDLEEDNVTIQNVSHVVEKNHLVVSLSRRLEAGVLFTLRFNYSGIIGPVHTSGLHWTRYRVNGTTRCILWHIII